jgi:hypothetical protein
VHDLDPTSRRRGCLVGTRLVERGQQTGADERVQDLLGRVSVV